MPESSDIGTRLRDIRKRRGLTQQELATASKVSVSLIRKLEQGDLETTRMETARSLAVALRVPTTRLLDRGDAPSADAATTDLWLETRQTVIQPITDTAEDAPTIAGVRAATDAAQAARMRNQFSHLARALPALLRDAEALDESAEARDTRARALMVAGATLTQVHQYDAAETALHRALDYAQDRALAAAAVASQCWLATRQGRLGAARDLAIRWADDIEPRMSRATPDQLAAWGRLLLKVASIAVRDNRPGEAADALRLARSAAMATGYEIPTAGHMAMWGPMSVAYIQAEVHAIRDEPEKVLEVAARLPVPASSDSRRQLAAHNRHRLDQAHAHVSLRQHGEAVQILSDIHRAAPQWLAQQRYARDVMGRIVETRRTLSPEMRVLADAVALPL